MAANVFDFDSFFDGVMIVVGNEHVSGKCMNGGEVDGQIKLLKDNLDVVAKRMKLDLKKKKAITFK